MNFKDWKEECKKIIYEQTEGFDREGLAQHNIECVEDWEHHFDNGSTPSEAIDYAREESLDNYDDNQ